MHRSPISYRFSVHHYYFKNTFKTPFENSLLGVAYTLTLIKGLRKDITP